MNDRNTSLATVEAQAVTARSEALPTAQSETAAVLSMIERLAKDPTVDIDRVERMMVLHREMRAEKAREAFNVALSNVQRRLPQIKRDAANKETHSRYARLETISAQVDPIIADAGLSLSYGTESSALQNHYKVVCTVALGIHERRFELDTPADAGGIWGNTNKTAIQAMGSSISYARRYLKLMIFDIALTNEDNDGNRVQDDRPVDREPPRSRDENTRGVVQSDEQQKQVSRVLSAEQVQQIRKALAFTGETEQRFCASIKIKSIEGLDSQYFKETLEHIRSVGMQK